LTIDGVDVQVELAATAVSVVSDYLSVNVALNPESADSIPVVVTYNGVDSNGADILIAAYNGSTLLGWTIYNRSTNLDAGIDSATATITLDFDLARFNSYFTTSGLTLMAWQGTAYVGTGSDASPGLTYGTTTSVSFRANSISGTSTTSTLSSSGLTRSGTTIAGAQTNFADVTFTEITLDAISDGEVVDVPLSPDLDFELNSDLSGSLSVSPETVGVVFGISGGSASERQGFDLEKAGEYGVLYLNSSTGDYLYVANPSAVDALDQGVEETDEFVFTAFRLDTEESKSIGVTVNATKNIYTTTEINGTTTDPWRFISSANAYEADGTKLGQSFKVDGEGTFQIDEAVFWLQKKESTTTGTITLTIRDSWSGAVLYEGTANLADLTATSSDSNFERVVFDLTWKGSGDDPGLSAGQTYIFRFSATAGKAYVLGGTSSDKFYPGGALIQDGTAKPLNAEDLVFELKGSVLSGGIEEVQTTYTVNIIGASEVDEDPPLNVSNVTVNEGSPYAVFTVGGVAGQLVSLALDDGTADGDDYGSGLEYFDGTEWVEYTLGDLVALDEEGELLVRTTITQDDEYEVSETFTLIVTNAGGTEFEGTGTIVDDGTGEYFAEDNNSGDSVVPEGVFLDDDRDVDGIDNDIEDALANLAGGSNDLNGDGIPDSQQNALATLAWTVKANFDTSTNPDTVNDTPTESIITLGVMSGTADEEGKYDVDSTYKLVAIEVLAEDDEDVGGGKPVSLNGQAIVSPWDPIRFAVEPNNAEGTLTDLGGDPSNGTQILVVIDISRANLDEGYFNAYLKYVSAEVLSDAADKGVSLVDLDGDPITSAGWYDFTRRTDASGNFVGDGAVFKILDGKIVAIELYFTDNAFGDNDMDANRIFDPGLPVFLQPLAVEPPVNAPAPARPVARPEPVAPDAVVVQQVVPPQPDGQLLAPPGAAAAIEQLPEMRSPHVPLRFDSALHPLLALASLAPSDLTEPVNDNRFPVESWMRYFDLYATQGDWRVAVLPAEGDQLAVFRGMGDLFVEAGATGEIAVPWDAFSHSQTDAVVALEAKLVDGAALPAWLRFDPRTGRFSYRLPADWRGELVVRVLARDAKGNEVSTLFRLQVGERAKASGDRPVNAGLQEQLRDAARQRQMTDWARAENAAWSAQVASLAPVLAH
jgi:hypothetical protein